MRAAKAAAARRATRVRRLLARAPASASGGRAACARWPRRTPARTLPLMYGPADADLLRLGLAVGDEAGHRRHAHVGSARRLAATTDGRPGRRQGLLLGQERRICKDLVHLVAHSLVRHRGVTLAVAAPEWRRRARAHAHRLGLPVGGRPPVQHGRKSRSARERADSTRLASSYWRSCSAYRFQAGRGGASLAQGKTTAFVARPPSQLAPRCLQLGGQPPRPARARAQPARPQLRTRACHGPHRSLRGHMPSRTRRHHRLGRATSPQRSQAPLRGRAWNTLRAAAARPPCATPRIAHHPLLSRSPYGMCVASLTQSLPLMSLGRAKVCDSHVGHLG